jgi:hypothetical protein
MRGQLYPRKTHGSALGCLARTGFAIALDAQALAILFDFVEPFWPDRNLIPVGETELTRLKHAAKISLNIVGRSRTVKASEFDGERKL